VNGQFTGAGGLLSILLAKWDFNAVMLIAFALHLIAFATFGLLRGGTAAKVATPARTV
jgi:hypothetical protein